MESELIHTHRWKKSVLRPDQQWCEGCRSWLFKGVIINQENYVRVASAFIRSGEN